MVIVGKSKRVGKSLMSQGVHVEDSQSVNCGWNTTETDSPVEQLVSK